MNWVDIVIIVAMVVSVFVGIRIGIIKAAMSLVGIIVGVALAGQYYGPLAERLTFISNTGIADAVAFVIIMATVMAIAIVLAVIIKWAASALLLGWVNSLGGAVFGLAMAAFFMGAILTLWVKFLGITDVVSDSSLAGFLLDGFPAALAILPSEFDTVREFFQ